MDIAQFHCPRCSSTDLAIHDLYQTKNNGKRALYRCQACNDVFSETKNTFLENLVKPISLIAKVFEARSEGMGFNATCRLFEISKNTLSNWERKLSRIKQTLMMYALLIDFIELTIEGDELYTKVNKNKPVEDCEGWTIVLMERAIRFIWSLQCGKKDRDLFLMSIQVLADVVECTNNVTLLTDGERRYGKILFEICNEIVRTGRPGRPPRVLLEGLKVRLKNKGSQNKKRSKEKYEAPQREHPNTKQDIKNKDIHANHVEAFNAALRRLNSAYRRKTNTYAKNTEALQRTLDIVLDFGQKGIRCLQLEGMI